MHHALLGKCIVLCSSHVSCHEIPHTPRLPTQGCVFTMFTQTQRHPVGLCLHWCPCCMQAAAENGQDEMHVAVGPKRKKRAWEEDSDEGPDSEDERERQRQEDQRAKEEFEQRLRDRDEAKTRKLMEAKLSKEEIEVCPACSSPLTHSPASRRPRLPRSVPLKAWGRVYVTLTEVSCSESLLQ